MSTPGLVLEGFSPRPLSLLFCLSEVCCAQGSFSGGFLQKQPKWISHQCNFAFLLCQPLACNWRVFSCSLVTFELYLTGWPCPRGLARYFQADGFLSNPLFTLPKLFAINVPFFQPQFIQFAMKHVLQNHGNIIRNKKKRGKAQMNFLTAWL